MAARNILKQWALIGLLEIIVALVLASIAPIFFNSNWPILGFLIWFCILTVLGGSGLYVAFRLADAHKARHLFLSKFPEYHALKVTAFLTIPASRVRDRLELLEVAKEDPDLQALQISPLDLLRGVKKQ